MDEQVVWLDIEGLMEVYVCTSDAYLLIERQQGDTLITNHCFVVNVTCLVPVNSNF